MDTFRIRCYLSLLALPCVGPATVARLVRAAGSPGAALRLEADALRGLGLREEPLSALLALRGRPDSASEAAADWLLEHGVALIELEDPRYPALLAQIACPPPLLFVKGAVDALGSPQLAMVGSRKPTAAGRETAFSIAAELAGYGLTITSGLALGIDTESHRGALHGGGATIAVMGTGCDAVYPLRNRALAQQILDRGGALVSEFAPRTRPEAANFPRRNRIISGLSLGVLVVEAALPSGSLLSARYAAEQDRELMAVPGPVRSPVSRGCHELIRQGAALVEDASHVLQALGDRFAPRGARDGVCPANSTAVFDSSTLAPDERRVFEAAGYEAATLEMLIERTGLGAAAVGAAMVRLELRGLVVAEGSGYARRP